MGAPLVREIVVGTNIEIGSAAWIEWLKKVKSFRFESAAGSFTAIKKGEANKHWYADRRKRGKLYTRYLGLAENIDLEKCAAILFSIAFQAYRRRYRSRNPTLWRIVFKRSKNHAARKRNSGAKSPAEEIRIIQGMRIK